MKNFIAFITVCFAIMIVGCGFEQQPPAPSFRIGLLKKNIEMPADGGTPTYPTQTSGQNQSPGLNSNGPIIYIVCFYGANDTNNVAQNMCAQAMTLCQQTYGNACQRVNNPTPQELQQLNANQTGIVYVVTHSTPGNTTDPSNINIWDSQCTPGQISQQFCGTPVVWYGCYGYNVQQCYNNVVSPQTTGTVLNSGNPQISCMMMAITYCAQMAATQNPNGTYTNTQLQQCALQNMQQMPGCANVQPPPAPNNNNNNNNANNNANNANTNNTNTNNTNTNTTTDAGAGSYSMP